MAAGGIKCLKYLMFIFNFFFWVGVLYSFLVCLRDRERKWDASFGVFRSCTTANQLFLWTMGHKREQKIDS